MRVLLGDPDGQAISGRGEVRRQFNICFTAQLVGGELRGSDESTEVRWVRQDELDDLSMHRTQRLRLRHYLDRTNGPHLGQPHYRPGMVPRATVSSMGQSAAQAAAFITEVPPRRLPGSAPSSSTWARGAIDGCRDFSETASWSA